MGMTINTGEAQEAAQGEMTETVEHPSGAVNEVKTPVELPMVGTGALAILKYAAGATRNLGDFNSARVDVGIELPCPVESIDEGFLQARVWVDTRLKELLGG